LEIDELGAIILLVTSVLITNLAILSSII
jgi:hypothetical protein